VNKALETKLKDLPKEPGVYFHKSRQGEIIYVGKAAVLRNRVRQYFQASRNRDPKTEALVEEIYDTDWMVVESELEALFLEAEMIRRYMPRYNILLRDDKAMSYIRIDYSSDYPTVTTTRRPLDDGAMYFGPYFSTFGVRQALKFLRRIFPFATHKPQGHKRASLYYHIGLDPGLEDGRTSLEDYRKNLRKLIAVIQGKRTFIVREIEKDMKNETIGRRLSEKNLKQWGKPDLVLIDGGKGQLDAAIQARNAAGQSQIPFIGLAKREEQIVIQKGKSNVTLNEQAMHGLGGFATESDDFILVNLPHSTNAVKLLQRIRDESHRFAVSYHSVLKVKRQTASVLDNIPTIGPTTRKKLIKTFGSMRGVLQARDQDLVHLLGEKKAAILQQYLRPIRKEQKLAVDTETHSSK
jgi:excinuclease UvrABC nuclease subunit